MFCAAVSSLPVEYMIRLWAVGGCNLLLPYTTSLYRMIVAYCACIKYESLFSHPLLGLALRLNLGLSSLPLLSPFFLLQAHGFLVSPRRPHHFHGLRASYRRCTPVVFAPPLRYGWCCRGGGYTGHDWRCWSARCHGCAGRNILKAADGRVMNM